MSDLINYRDFERKAKEILPLPAYDFFAGGAGDELTLRENHDAYDQIKFRSRVLSSQEHCDLSTKILNQTLSMPLLCAPIGFQGMAHPEGEIATVKAANQQGVSVITSTMSNSSLEAAALASEKPLWFQLYVYKDKTITESLVQRAQQANYQALVLTVDTPRTGLRERDLRNDFTLPPGLTIKNLEMSGFHDLGQNKAALMEYSRRLFGTSLSWKDIVWLKSITKLPILLKGIVHPDDALKAFDHGADGVIVSNHGGRQLDTSVPTIRALPDIANVLNNRIPLLIDGGIRRGIDIVKAIALGADAVLIGRPILWGLAVDGQQGVEQILEMFRNELVMAMTLFGFSSINEIKQEGKHYLIL